MSFDELHQRIIHQQQGGFSTVDIVDEGNTPDGLFVKFDPKGLKFVRFSPDGLYFAFLCDKRRMGCIETLHPTHEPIPLSLKWNRTDSEVLNFFWLPSMPQQAEYADLVVVTPQGLEIFRLFFEQRVFKSLKAVSSAIRMCWVEPMSGMLLVCTGPRTLQPFDLRSKTPKMPKFDLYIDSNQMIEAHDVAVMTIYDTTFCIHADSTHGRVSLRNISNPLHGTPEHDIVIVIADRDTFTGTLRLSKVDNLLIVHHLEKKQSMIFDIRHKEKSAASRSVVPSICGPCPVEHNIGSTEEVPWSQWDYLGGSTIMDYPSRKVYRLKIDMGAILQAFLARSPQDLATVTQFLLRRSNCREHIVQTLKNALLSQTSCTDWSQAFAVLNSAYRQTIESVSQKSPTSMGRQATVSLQELEAVMSHQSILTEKDMVSQVFYPHFMEITGIELSSQNDVQVKQDHWHIPLPPVGNTNEVTNGNFPTRKPSILSVVVAYLRSLLGMQILPHKILQCFVFDICMYLQQDHTLQQLLHYHVLVDSPELVLRLQEVAVTKRCAWATQACLDMALRMHEFTVIADMLLHTKQYLDVVPFLMNQHGTPFKIRRLLEQIDNDIQSHSESPDLREHILTEIRMWRNEAASASDAEQIMPPDLERCEKWMPDLTSRNGDG